MADSTQDPQSTPTSQTPDHQLLARDPGRFSVNIVDERLKLEGVDLGELARQVGTPAYVYSRSSIESKFRQLSAALDAARVGADFSTCVCFAVKANSNQAVLSLLAKLGAGADIVSGGELRRALKAGFPGDRIVFSGVAKSDAEIDAAIEAGVRSINIESEFEWRRVLVRAEASGLRARVSFRVNPDVDPATHPYLATGINGSKFGISVQDAHRLALEAHAHPAVDFVGLACHIGSQIVEAKPFLACVERMSALVADLRAQGVEMRQIDLGGGLGIVYGEGDAPLEVETWGRHLLEAVAPLGLDLVVEPGRYLVGNAGVLLTTVHGSKSVAATSSDADHTAAAGLDAFVIIDAAMNDLLRPALYGAEHAIVNTRDPLASGASDEQLVRVDVVGPVCECGDFLGKNRRMPMPEPGDVLAVLSAGAYGMAMASYYNSRSLPVEVLVDSERHAITRPRVDIDEHIDHECVPDWV